METEIQETPSWLDRPIISFLPRIKVETVLIALILILALVSRFYDLGARVMSHDEVNHVVPSWELFTGNGYRHDPVTHGPMQFHLVTLSYFLLGDNDFSARVPAAIFSVAAVAAVLFGFRRYLGRNGTIIAGALFLISPFMLFYGRYTRNEAFIELFGVLILYGILRYLERGDKFSLYLISIVTALHFATKETAFIYTAQYLLFTGVLFLEGVARIRWEDTRARNRFLTFMVIALTLFLGALGLAAWNASLVKTVEGGEASGGLGAVGLTVEILMFIGAVALAVIGVVLLVQKLGWKPIRDLRAFDLMILVGTLILPQLAAFPVKMIGWDPLDYSSAGMVKTGAVLLVMTLISIGIGLWWRPRLWVGNAVVFYAIFTVFYTTFFTNGNGFFTGLIGALGYWLSQQEVQRGSQPWYYYAALQVPVYEFLAALGTLLAVYFGVRHNRFAGRPGERISEDAVEEAVGETPATEDAANVEDHPDILGADLPGKRLPTLSLLLFWSVTSLVAYSMAGEKMPWLTVHVALPLLLAAGWGLGYLTETTPWKQLFKREGLLALLLIPVFSAAFAALMGKLLGSQPPFQGNELFQLEATNTFLLAFAGTVLSAGGITYLLRDWQGKDVLRLAANAFFALLAVLTARAAYRASFINYDYATEYLVYAHAAPGPKEVLKQIEEISKRTTGGLDVMVAYDNDMLYPYWWYLRDYPNHRWYQDQPTRDLADYPLIVAGDASMDKMEPIVKDNYVAFNYIRLWWPNQDYYGLTWERIRDALRNPEMRAAIFKIWLNRDYKDYARLTGNTSMTATTWQPSARMRFYIRKDILAQMWNYGAMPEFTPSVVEDPYTAGQVALVPDRVAGTAGTEPGQLNAPRDMAIGPDGSLYVADSRNHRIQRFNANGDFLQAWGSFGDAIQAGGAPGGLFNEPWGLDVAPDGSVYVADTWNHRVQKFTAEGEFVTMWGYFGTAEAPDAFWGPRDVAVDANGYVYITDTGNKRVVVFDQNGKYIAQFGAQGLALGEFDEPVGLAIDREARRLYLADTWNRRVQVFGEAADGTLSTPLKEFDMYGWFGESLDNKPYLTVGKGGDVFVVDPEGYRVVQFSPEGEFKRTWGQYSLDVDGFALAASVVVDAEGRVWVSDAVNNRLLRFVLPE
ncbi:hypothetical protein ADN00_06970 [Ornatilinea apprima]|uniref:Glycosyltransferase RgtA/B/C/D-like domain-containing protein n=1 Tax=Ornatilinea apprima TaxID=1134406 RepID=A0A0N8GNI8_9CHLR|nr:glycosyltransferase family 39 protein [Ornatilinea apprima]KPL78218.1 hypothetical protein ADN00_06970 [Ornatilinea apprima]